MRTLATILTILLISSVAFTEEDTPKGFYGTWEPSSKVFLSFGDLTIDKDTLTWESSQKSTYRVIESKGEKCVVELTSEPIPKLHDSTFKIIVFYVTIDYPSTLYKKSLTAKFYENVEGLKTWQEGMSGTYIMSELGMVETLRGK